jgi:hypothetical protein
MASEAKSRKKTKNSLPLSGVWNSKLKTGIEFPKSASGNGGAGGGKRRKTMRAPAAAADVREKICNISLLLLTYWHSRFSGGTPFPLWIIYYYNVSNSAWPAVSRVSLIEKCVLVFAGHALLARFHVLAPISMLIFYLGGRLDEKRFWYSYSAELCFKLCCSLCHRLKVFRWKLENYLIKVFKNYLLLKLWQTLCSRQENLAWFRDSWYAQGLDRLDLTILAGLRLFWNTNFLALTLIKISLSRV